MAQWRATRRNFRRTHAARHYCIARSRHRQRREQGWFESVFPKCSHSGNQKRKQRAHQRRKKDGWKILWDGNTTKGWRRPEGHEFRSKSWRIENGELSVISSGNAEAQAGGDIITRERYSNFELLTDFKLTPGCNSGI